jgi:dephospho-CoA kinase
VHVVGLTGGIGSGKSALSGVLRELGIPVVDADAVARRCVAPGTPGLAEIVDRFGPAIVLSDGSLDRAALARIVFADADARRDLEAITHPCIRAGIDAALDALRRQPRPPQFAVVEHPLLVETGGHARVDTVVVIEAPIAARIERLVSGRGMSDDEIRGRIAAQADDAGRRAVADHVILNDGDLEALRAQAVQLVDRLVAGEGR